MVVRLSLVCHVGDSSDVTLAFEYVQEIPLFSREETKNKDDTDYTDDIDDKDDTDDTEDTDDIVDTDDTDDTNDTDKTDVKKKNFLRIF